MLNVHYVYTVHPQKDEIIQTLLDFTRDAVNKSGFLVTNLYPSSSFGEMIDKINQTPLTRK